MRRDGRGRPGGGQEAAGHARDAEHGRWCWPSPATAAWPAPTTPRAARDRAAHRRAPAPRAPSRRLVIGGQEGAGATSASAASTSSESFPGFADRPEFADARDVAAAVVAARSWPARSIWCSWSSTRFISAGTQRVETHAAAPAAPARGEAEPSDEPRRRARSRATPSSSPSPSKLLAELAPRAVEAEIFAALLEGAASFFTAQQRAMAAATDNADELVRTLTRVMNRARQDAITTEIMEIVGGAEALRQSKGA